jgi:hypothetical protein
MVDSHKCIVDPDSIGYLGYMKERKLALCDGNCIVCGKEIIRALRPIHNVLEECKDDGCCKDDFPHDDGLNGCIPNPDTVRRTPGDNHSLVWECMNCDCWGVFGEGSGWVYEDEGDSIEFWSGRFFKTQ